MILWKAERTLYPYYTSFIKVKLARPARTLNYTKNFSYSKFPKVSASMKNGEDLLPTPHMEYQQ